MVNSRIYNGQMSGPSAGTAQVRVMEIDYGLSIIASADSEARSRRAFYPVTNDESSFSVTLGFVTYEEREGFNNWMSRFMTQISQGQAKYGTISVRVPVMNFSKIGVPQGPLDYGEGVGDMLYRSKISFVGSVNPVSINLAKTFKLPAHNVEGKYFYPAGIQVSGAEALDGSLFNAPPPMPAPQQTPVAPGTSPTAPKAV